MELKVHWFGEHDGADKFTLGRQEASADNDCSHFLTAIVPSLYHFGPTKQRVLGVFFGMERHITAATLT